MYGGVGFKKRIHSGARFSGGSSQQLEEPRVTPREGQLQYWHLWWYISASPLQCRCHLIPTCECLNCELASTLQCRSVWKHAPNDVGKHPGHKRCLRVLVFGQSSLHFASRNWFVLTFPKYANPIWIYCLRSLGLNVHVDRLDGHTDNEVLYNVQYTRPSAIRVRVNYYIHNNKNTY